MMAPIYVYGASVITVALSQSIAGLSTSFEVVFTLEEDAPEGADCYIDFPTEMMLPEKIKDNLITANNMPISRATIENLRVSFKLPEPLEDRKEIRIVMPVTIGLRNPLKSGNYYFLVRIGDIKGRGMFTIDPILKESPQVVIKPDKVGNKVGLTIQIPHPDELVIITGDTLKILMPVDFTIPEFLDPEFVVLCGKTVLAGSIEKNVISLVFGQDVDYGEPITAVFSPLFGIKSPYWPGDFILTISITGKMEETKSSPFQVFPLSPTLKISIDPPGEENKWYPTAPIISILSTAKREIYYYWDFDRRTLYSEPIIAPEGVHVLNFVGRVKNGGFEAVSSKMFRVDLEPPSFAGLPVSFNMEEVEFSYRVQDTSPCISGVGDETAEPKGDNRFKIGVILKPGPNKFVFWAKDSCERLVELQHTIILDKTPPALVVSSPKPLDTVCGRLVSIAGKTEPGSIVTIGGQVVEVNEKGEFFAAIAPVEEGPIEIKIEAVDLSGNKTSKVIPIIYIKSATITFKIDNSEANFAGITKQLELPPYRSFDQVFTPIPKISDALGYDLDKVDESFIFKDRNSKKTVSVTPGSNKIVIEGSGSYEVMLDTSPEMNGEILCVPVQFFDSGFGLKVLQDASDTIQIFFCPR